MAGNGTTSMLVKARSEPGKTIRISFSPSVTDVGTLNVILDSETAVNSLDATQNCSMQTLTTLSRLEPLMVNEAPAPVISELNPVIRELTSFME